VPTDIQIRELLQELARVYQEKNDLADPRVVQISQEMDKLIVEKQRQLMPV
jgi:ABC-type uncharacterized transport system involved in gliding motility auxiliary subunit